MDAYRSFTMTYHHSVYPAIDPSQDKLSARGKVVLITGGGQGIGKGIANSFILAKAEAVIITGRTKQTLAQTVHDLTLISEETGAPTKVQYFVNDVLDYAGIGIVLNTIRDQFGRVDILVNNAGSLTEAKPLVDSDSEKWWASMEVNTRGGYNVIRNFLKIAKNDAVILNVCSFLAHIPVETMSSYGASKIALLYALETLQQEYPSIRVHNLQPGMIATAMTAGADVPMEDDVELPGAFAVWLTSPEARFLAGRLAWANWDVEELKQREQIIVENNLCTIRLAV